MTCAGIVILWLGYTTLYWGLSFLSDKNLSFTQVAWPGKLPTAAPKKKPPAKGKKP